MVCGNITGNTSHPISITFSVTEPTSVSRGIPTTIENQGTEKAQGTNHPDDIEGIHSLTAYIASISSLAAALIVTVVISITVIAFILRRSKAKIKAALSESSN